MIQTRVYVVALLASLSASLTALAVPTQPRAWVSGVGVDGATCGTVDAPCRTFQHAHDNIVLDGGSIYVKDPANYAQVVITKSLSIINDNAGTATIFATSGTAIVVSGPVHVLIRGLTLDGAGTGVNGILWTSSGSLTVAKCIVRGFAGNGISLLPSSGGNVAVVDTLVTSNGSGIYTDGVGSGSFTLAVSRSQVLNNGFSSNGYGIRLTGGSAAYQFSTVDTTLIAGNGIGVSVEDNGSNVIAGNLVDSKVLGNNKSINVLGGGVLRLDRTAVQSYFPSSAPNGITNNGQIISFGNNAISDPVTGTAISVTALK